MKLPPRFPTFMDYRAHVRDVALWAPYVARVLERHGIPRVAPEAGFNPTYPVFVAADVVVKLFGFVRAWRATFEAERDAYERVARDGEIAAPRLLAEGQLAGDATEPWPYLVTSRASGTALREAALSPSQKLALAAQLGEQLRRVHALPPAGLAQVECSEIDLVRGAERSSLPPHLVEQVADFVAAYARPERVFVHGDVVAAHVFVDGGRLSGLIDWGDATRADPHYELIQLYRDTFACERSPFRAFLDAYDWPLDADFPQRTLAEALRRQASGFAAHRRMDVFEPIAARVALDRIEMLDDLARELFAL